MKLDPHSIRLFPKNCGANAYKITGIASRCDWVVLSDRTAPNIHVVKLSKVKPPRYVFLSLRAPFAALEFLAHKLLPELTSPFVLISGSEDVTLPRQLDQRWRPWSETEQQFIQSVLEHPMLLRWHAENLSDSTHAKLVPLPTGLVFSTGFPQEGVAVPAVAPLVSRPLRALCAHRVREGPQWALRRRLTGIALRDWSAWCTVLQEEMPEPEFLLQVQQHAFVLCVEGGGLDPSPKAWQVILHGAIPVIRRTATASVYRHLPVAFVDSWEAAELSPSRLKSWHDELHPCIDSESGRREIVYRLSAEFWWGQVSRTFLPPD